MARSAMYRKAKEGQAAAEKAGIARECGTCKFWAIEETARGCNGDPSIFWGACSRATDRITPSVSVCWEHTLPGQ